MTMGTLESSTLDETIKCASKWFIFFKMVHFNIKTQNLELVNLKCVTYAQIIPLSLTATGKNEKEYS